MTNIVTGHVADTSMREEHSSMIDALDWIEAQKRLDPIGVDQGFYYIDGPEEKTQS